MEAPKCKYCGKHHWDRVCPELRQQIRSIEKLGEKRVPKVRRPEEVHRPEAGEVGMAPEVLFPKGPSLEPPRRAAVPDVTAVGELCPDCAKRRARLAASQARRRAKRRDEAYGGR
jgi:hypothetical protein